MLATWSGRWAALLVAALPASAGAAVVQTIDRYTFLEGSFVGQTLTLETRYPAPDPGADYLQETGLAEVAFLSLSGTDDEALVINTEPRDFDGAEIYAEFAFDPSSNAAGLGGISIDPSGGFLVLVSGPGGDDVILPTFGRSGADWDVAFERSVALVPLPSGGALALGGLGAGLLLRIRRRPTRGNAVRAG